ncbi:histone-like nucleoid-structuring protein Lsr2 [Mesorhizobium japonicum]|uniref:histone-like nucleoid-structuring protein Lsr2 n=1 Tax=Mesorhizobium japonicum TaxID=2066070 RepID=UPI003B5B66DF
MNAERPYDRAVAKKQITILTDDLTGEEAPDAKTISFAIDGVSYEIDLGEASRQEFERALSPYVSAARKTRSARRGLSASGDSAAVREWARATGIEVPARGRIPANVVEQYRTR